jgi:hypothetical protein
MPPRSPNCFLIGAAKSGTSSLADWLGQHPDVFVPPSKESHFYASDAYFALGFAAYLRNEFANASSERVVVDASPSYLHLPGTVIPRMTASLDVGELRFLVLLRDPIDRALSHYLHQRRRGRETMSFEDAIRDEIAGRRRPDETWMTYVADGRYAAHLERWFGAFGREPFLVLKHEELRDGPRSVLRRAFTFLGVDDRSDATRLTRRNEARAVRYLPLARWIGKETWVKGLLRRILPYRLQRRLYRDSLRFLEKPLTDRPRVSTETREMLLTVYEPDLGHLESLLGWNVDDWRRTA